jgi:phosphatidylserine synthase 2
VEESNNLPRERRIRETVLNNVHENEVTDEERRFTAENAVETVSSGQDPKFSDEGDSFLFQAHTVTCLVILVAVLFYEALIIQPQADADATHRRGIYAIIFVFMALGVNILPDGPFRRPHFYIWRLGFCVSIVYLLGLIYLLFQDADTARQMLKNFDPKLGVELPETSYAEDCRLYTPGHPDGWYAIIWEKMDVFVWSHLLGWYVKALIIRDAWVLNIISIGFEMLEYTLACQLPNFGECWWDHWILDFVVCNGLGILLGMLTCHYLEMKTYHWRNFWKITTIKGKIKRAVGQFTPYYWTRYQWGYSESFTSFLFVLGTIVLWLLQELNGFYLKTVLWIPVKHELNVLRLIIYIPCGAVAMRELYDYLTNRERNPTIGRQCWVVFAMIGVETLIALKFGWEIITTPIPTVFVYFWVILFVVVFIWAAWKFTLPFRHMPVVGPPYRRLTRGVKSLFNSSSSRNEKED